jgi:hypothetical protein
MRKNFPMFNPEDALSCNDDSAEILGKYWSFMIMKMLTSFKLILSLVSIALFVLLTLRQYGSNILATQTRQTSLFLI